VTWEIEEFPLLPSTNDLALDRMRAGACRAGDVLIAAEQVAGRGRPGRSWHSPVGGLWMTAVLPFYPKRVGWTSLAAGLAVARAVRDLGAAARVKWPNDVLLDGRKLAGVLAETSSPDLVAIGIGLNVLNPVPDDPVLAARCARLVETVPGVQVATVRDSILAQLETIWRLLAAPDLHPLRSAWEELDAARGRSVLWSATRAAGIAEGVDAAGALLIRTSDGSLRAASVGEVSFTGP
jgi:biotin-[acetyl-CoA-carboxylase] ligase BirA-like protein